MDHRRLPARNLFDVGCLAAAGFLLLIPGLLTDLMGILLLFPRVRRNLYDAVTRHAGPDAMPRRGRDPRVIEGEFTRVDDKPG